MKNVSCVITKEHSILRVKISTEIEITLSCFLLLSIVKELKEVFKEISAEVLLQILHELENIWMHEKEAGIRICRFVKRTLNTTFGKITFKYRQAKKAGRYFNPLLEILGIENHKRITEDLKETAILASLYTSYRKALKIAGNVISLHTLWSSVQDKGKMYIDKRNKAIYYYTEGEPIISSGEKDFAVLMIDEIWLRQRKKKQFIKVKVARLEVTRFREGVYVFEPLRIFATAKNNQKTFLQKAREFFEATAGLALIPRIMVLTDGCTMGKSFCEFYPEKAIWQIDWWHLWNYVHKGCKFEKDLEKKIWDLLNVEKVDEALGILCAYRECMKSAESKIKDIETVMNTDTSIKIKPEVFWKSSQREHIEKLISYLSKNREGIYGVKAFQKEIPAEYLPFGSGPVERLQAVMIAYRMKKQGKHWSVEGAENLIALLSKEWNCEDVENILEQGLKDLAQWERLPLEELSIQEEFFKIKRTGFALSPNPISSVYILRRGKTDSFFRPLHNISESKLLTRYLEFRKEGCPSL